MLMDLAALFTPQNRRLFKLTTFVDTGPDLLLENFVGFEELSVGFGFELSLLCQDASVKLKSLMGQQVTIEIELADGSSRFLNGYVTRFDSKGSNGGIARYSATFSSWLSMLSYRFDSRIFQDQTVEDVVAQVFAGFGALPKYEFRLSKPLKPRSYITQYRESDENFVKRLLEVEGLFFYFEHTAETHLMVITDDSSALVPLTEQPQIRFHTASVTETADSITEWHANRQLQSGKIAVQTFDYQQPQNRLPVAMKSLNQQGEVDAYEIYDFPGQYTHGTHEDGEAIVRKRVEALELLGKTFYGSSNCRAMKPGYTFELTQHYEHDKGSAEDRQFLLIRVEHGGSNNYLPGDEAGYQNKFWCVRKKIVFRPQLSTRHPTISGPQTAIVVGPPGEEIYTDKLGRVKLQYHWDRNGNFDDKSSCWVRVAQSGASGGFGSILIPRVGDEVVVVFLDGNPDRPLIMGSVYNGENTPPWSLPENKTQSGFLTRSMKGKGANANFFRFDDKQAAEQIIIHAERNMDTEIEANETRTVGGNRTTNVSGAHSEKIKLDTSIVVEEGTFVLTVDQKSITLKAATSITLEVGQSSLTMNADGTITLSGVNIDVIGSTKINLNE